MYNKFKTATVIVKKEINRVKGFQIISRNKKIWMLSEEEKLYCKICLYSKIVKYKSNQILCSQFQLIIWSSSYKGMLLVHNKSLENHWLFINLSKRSKAIKELIDKVQVRTMDLARLRENINIKPKILK